MWLREYVHNQPLIEKTQSATNKTVSFDGLSNTVKTKITPPNPNQQAVEKCHADNSTVLVHTRPNKRFGLTRSNTFLFKISLYPIQWCNVPINNIKKNTELGIYYPKSPLKHLNEEN
ncbi:hypothetical protein [Pseudoalteromonas luteoviolacea]|uniref:hypothetical protein n=1 Tax=Pseudoalteromonas luteoviolacea TaxID=43657 RepID=UPI001B35D8BB|nr:hypothetical protein [Pseudoalteromonas luteoviolacea]MBQ4838580.1 hypothetical protein [Pseudoalteromonas luteoviolacea]